MSWIKSNDFRKTSKLEEFITKRVRILSHEEKERLLEACQKSSPYLHLLVILALYTGARKMALLELQWNKIDLHRCLITLYDQKDDREWSISLGGYPLELMRNYASQFTKKTKWVFPSEIGNEPIDIEMDWSNALKQAAISDFRFYDLRRTAMHLKLIPSMPYIDLPSTTKIS